MILFVEFADLGVTVVEEQDVVVGLALLAHDGSAYLAEAYTMAPSAAVETETFLTPPSTLHTPRFYLEGGGEQMGLAEGTTDLEFLADGERLLGAHNLQFPDAPALATLQGDEFLDDAEVVFQFAVDEF